MVLLRKNWRHITPTLCTVGIYNICKIHILKFVKTNTMNKLHLILLFVPLISLGQVYSNYYGTLDVNANVNQNINANVNINKNVDVSGNVNVNKTITTIDYEALRLANAQREKNRLESIKYNDSRSRIIAFEIANDPSKAVDYGNPINVKLDKKWVKANGWKKGYLKFKELNNLLFQKEGFE